VRALIAAGGTGSRLRPFTHTGAKQLLPVAGQPILFHGLDAIRDAGIREVGIVVGQTADEVRAAVGDGGRWGLDVTYIEQPEPLGLAHVVTTARDFVAGRPFLFFLGDNLILEGVSRFVREFERSRPDAQIFLARVHEPERFGVVVMEGDRVVRLVEKPTAFVSDLALVGVYLFRDSILEACDSLRPSWRGEYEITEAIQWLVDHGKRVRAEVVEGWWKDTGVPEDLLEANRRMLASRRASVEGEVDAESELEGIVIVQAGAKVVASRLEGPVVVGAGALVERSVVGPGVSVADGCRVADSVVRDAILMSGCRVTGVDSLEGSILGRDVEVRSSGGSGTRTLLLGDHARVEV
jgi:glucose-1-phosphate thymidylyltransferase